jgi:hypothetical protein
VALEGATERDALETGADDEGLALETGADETGATEGEGAALETGAGEGDAEGDSAGASAEGAGVSSSSGAALRHSVLEPAMTLTGEVADVSPVLSVTMMVTEVPVARLTIQVWAAASVGAHDMRGWAEVWPAGTTER